MKKGETLPRAFVKFASVILFLSGIGNTFF